MAKVRRTPDEKCASCVPTRRKRAVVRSALYAVFDERGPALVREPCHLACEEISGFCPKTAELFEDTESDALACLYSLCSHQRHLRTNNGQERCDRKLKRKTQRRSGVFVEEVADSHPRRGLFRDGRELGIQEMVLRAAHGIAGGNREGIDSGARV